MKEMIRQWAEDHVVLVGLIIGVLVGVGVTRFEQSIAPWIVDILCDIAGQR